MVLKSVGLVWSRNARDLRVFFFPGLLLAFVLQFLEEALNLDPGWGERGRDCRNEAEKSSAFRNHNGLVISDPAGKLKKKTKQIYHRY